MAARTTPDRVRLGDEIQAQVPGARTAPFPSVADAIYEQLWRRVVNLEFEPGQRLVEDTLAQELGTSRTPVREALLRLSQVGIVTFHSRRGFSVPSISRADVEELYDLRTAIETYATRKATPLISAEEIELYRRAQASVLEARASARAEAAEAFVRADLALHMLLHTLAGNARSTRLLSDLLGQLSLVSMRAATDPVRNRAAIAEHQRVLDAIESRDPDRAAAEMARHIQAVKERALDDLELERT